MRPHDELAAMAAQLHAAQTIAAELEEAEAEATAAAQYGLGPRARRVSKAVVDLHRPPTVGGRPPRTLQWTTNDPMRDDPAPETVAQLTRWDPRAKTARYILVGTKAAHEIGALLDLGLTPTAVITRNAGVEVVIDTPPTTLDGRSVWTEVEHR